MCKHLRGAIVACLAFLFFSGTGTATPITLTLNATVTSTSITLLDPSPPMTFYGGMFVPFRMETVAVNDPITVTVSLNIDDPNFLSSNDAVISDDGYCITDFTVFDSLGGFLGRDVSLGSELRKVGSLLRGDLISGPNIFDFNFEMDLDSMTGSLSIMGAGSGHPYDGLLTAGITDSHFTAVPEPAVAFTAPLIAIAAAALARRKYGQMNRV